MAPLDQALKSVARTESLLVAVDFDGTLAPIVEHPDDAVADSRSIGALTRLVEMPLTSVAIVTGRALDDLAHLMPDIPKSFRLVGSHGAEMAGESADFESSLSDDERELVECIRETVESASVGLDGLFVEHKGGSSTLHYRRADRDTAARALRRLCRARSDRGLDGARFRRGKKVVEVFAVHAGKDHAVARLREVAHATGTVYIGDDRTDEDAFGVMGLTDVAVKVGAGPTVAAYRVATTHDVARVLEQLADERQSTAP